MIPKTPLKSHFYTGLTEAGCDEAGRGCLAGSVYAAAVILPDGYDNPGLNDSKQMSERQRYALREQVMRDAVAWAVGVVTPDEIDHINILNASILAMHRALDQAQRSPPGRHRRRQPLQALWRPALHHHRQGRRQVWGHRRRQHPGQDFPRRLHGPSGCRISHVWLAQEQGLPHPRASRGHTPAWHQPLPSSQL